MARERASGILLHPTSFPGPHGIGDLGDSAYHFVDWIFNAHQRYWQVMPLGPTGYGDSPYASPSSFAGNPLLVSLQRLVEDGLLSAHEIYGHHVLPDHVVDFGRVIPFKTGLLRTAYERFAGGAGAHLRAGYDQFCVEHGPWLEDYALFMALKAEHDLQSWTTWERPLRLREPDALEKARHRLSDAIRFHRFVQFQFRRQWSALKAYANERGIKVIGDIPIFVAMDSADVWANQSLFKLTADGHPEVVSGVPPDYFSDDGQLWGNPVYDWTANAADDFAWWVSRIRSTLHFVDVIRIDHFRGFAANWSVPADASTAALGRWVRGPGMRIFESINRQLGTVEIIVEDLGLITTDVVELRNQLGYPGMTVLQFAFDGDPDNLYLPHNHITNSVVYTGTHDNQTTVGWFQSLTEEHRTEVQRYIGRDGSDIAWDFIRDALLSVSETAIIPLQDVMRLDDHARMNTPGKAMGNWGWRYLPHQLHSGVSNGLGELTAAYGRQVRPPHEKEHDPYDYTAPGTTVQVHGEENGSSSTGHAAPDRQSDRKE